MSQFTEEHIFNYLDDLLTSKQNTELELAMQADTDLKETVDRLRTAHLCLQDNNLESGPDHLSNQIMSEVIAISKKEYYSPSGLFSSTNFVLISGVLTAVEAFLSLVSAGYFNFQDIVPGLTELSFIKDWDLLNGGVSKKLITNTALVIFGILALALVDRLVLNPIFRRRYKSIGLN